MKAKDQHGPWTVFACSLAVAATVVFAVAAAQAAPGGLDPSFGSGGKVQTAIGSFSAAYAVAVRRDGKIVAVGWSGTGETGVGGFAIARYEVDGSLDPSFGAGGTVTTPFAAGDADAHAVALQPDGKIVVAGNAVDRSYPEWRWEFALARYNPDGSLDTSFGEQGKVTTPGFAETIVLQANGKIVAVGGVDNAVALVRYNLDGSLDTTFGEGGRVLTPAPFTGARMWGGAAVLQPNQKIVVAAGMSDVGRIVVLRYNERGSLDPTFGSDGEAITRLGSSTSGTSAPVALALEAGGKIIVAGAPRPHGKGPGSALLRYTRNGRLDKTFGEGGKVTTRVGGAMAITPLGKIVVAGTVGDGGGFTVIRYRPNGARDTSFGTNGIATTRFCSTGRDVARGLALQRDDKIVVVGFVCDRDPSPATFGLARFLAG